MGEGRQRQQADRLFVLTDEGKQLPHQQHTQDCRLVWTLWAGGVRELQPEMCARHITDAVDGAGVVRLAVWALVEWDSPQPPSLARKGGPYCARGSAWYRKGRGPCSAHSRCASRKREWVREHGYGFG